MSLRVLITVTHLLGVGHLARAAALGRAFAGRGHAVTLVSGGRPAPLVGYEGISLVQLPPLRVDGTDFKALRTEAGEPADEAYLASRRDVLLATLHEVRPDVVLTELYPFGRRVLAAEFKCLLDAAHAMSPRPLVVSSIRDILATPTKPGRIEEAHEMLERFYDLVLVHGDPALVPLDASWPVDDRIRPLLRVTGYVDEGAPVTPTAQRHGIVVSGGSSGTSLPLYQAAVGAAHLVPDHPWHLLAGVGIAEDAFQSLVAAAPENMRVERARPDFRSLLAEAAVSVSQAGYNTFIDLLRARPAMVLVPFQGGTETEQRLRTERLCERGLAALVSEDELSPERLAEAVREALARPAAARSAFSLDGAATSVALVEEAVTRSPAVSRPPPDWSPLDEALHRARDRGARLRFWWRDDDAVADTPQLRRLLDLAHRYRTPVAVAAIPARLDPTLVHALAASDLAQALVHGFAHRNHAPEGEKKAEFGPHRSLTAMELDLRAAWREGNAALRPKLLPVFVPPWNRIAPALLPALAKAGYRGLSTFKDRERPEAAPGLVQANTHIDPIDWRGSRGLADPEWLIGACAALIDARSRHPDPEPIGILSHHLVHDEAIWGFCEGLIERLSRNNIRFSLASAVFLEDNRIVVGA